MAGHGEIWLERHDLLQPNQRVTRLRQRRIPIVQIEEPMLRHHPARDRVTRRSESSNRSTHQGFFEVSAWLFVIPAPEGG